MKRQRTSADEQQQYTQAQLQYLNSEAFAQANRQCRAFTKSPYIGRVISDINTLLLLCLSGQQEDAVAQCQQLLDHFTQASTLFDNVCRTLRELNLDISNYEPWNTEFYLITRKFECLQAVIANHDAVFPQAKQAIIKLWVTQISNSYEQTLSTYEEITSGLAAMQQQDNDYSLETLQAFKQVLTTCIANMATTIEVCNQFTTVLMNDLTRLESLFSHFSKLTTDMREFHHQATTDLNLLDQTIAAIGNENDITHDVDLTPRK